MRLSQLVDRGVREGVFVSCHGRVVSELIRGAALRLRHPAFLAQANLTIEEAFQEFYRVLLGGLLANATVPKTVQSDNQTNRVIARGISERRRDVCNDEVDGSLESRLDCDGQTVRFHSGAPDPRQWPYVSLRHVLVRLPVGNSDRSKISAFQSIPVKHDIADTITSAKHGATRPEWIKSV